MIPMVLVSLAIALSLAFSTVAHATEITYDSHGFRIDGTYRLLRGGTIQWFRIPEEQWEDRLRRFKAAGFNTVDLYVPWNVVEPHEGQFNFTQPNLKRFLQLIQSLNLYAYFRPGPYITNEMDSGGIPNWVIGKSTKTQRRADGRPVLRDNDPDYVA